MVMKGKNAVNRELTIPIDFQYEIYTTLKKRGNV